jgi:hypothetical protein
MKRIVVPASLILSLVFLGACEDNRPRQQRRPGGFHPPAPKVDDRGPANPEETEPTEPREKHTRPDKPSSPEPTPNPVPDTPKPVGEIPYGKGVPGKPGFVTSPFSPYSGYIDVRGFPPGTEVKDPYSGKTFLVP